MRVRGAMLQISIGPTNTMHRPCQGCKRIVKEKRSLWVFQPVPADSRATDTVSSLTETLS